MTTAVSSRQRNKTYDMAYISMFTVIIAISSWISIPMTCLLYTSDAADD